MFDATAIVTVGDGRGFLIESKSRHLQRMVITAAHCLPSLPPADPGSYSHERTYPNLLAPLDATPAVMATCLFVDPIADVAILGQPDNQACREEAEAYDTLVNARSALRIAVLSAPCDARLLTLIGRWESCMVQPSFPGLGNTLTLIGVKDGNAPGTSGSPIVRAADGHVVGVVSIGSETNSEVRNEQWGQPALAGVLPLWLLANLRVNLTQARSASRQWARQ